MRFTMPETTGVSQVLNGFMFTQLELSEHEAMNYGAHSHPEHAKLRHKFINQDLWDTLTPDVVDMMISPYETYDPDYQRQVNIAMLSCIKTLENRINSLYRAGAVTYT